MHRRRISTDCPPCRELMPPFSLGVWVHWHLQGENAPNARLFWLPEVDPAIVGVRADPVPLSDPDAFNLTAFAAQADLLMDRHGREFLLLDDGAHQIELQIRSGTLSNGPVRLTCEVELFAGADAKLLTMSRLTAFRRMGRFPLNLYPPERRAPKWALALQAYDGMRAGASLREIAAVLFTEKLVREEWNGRSAFLKARVQRLLHYGRKMVNGDYKTLLQ